MKIFGFDFQAVGNADLSLSVIANNISELDGIAIHVPSFLTDFDFQITPFFLKHPQSRFVIDYDLIFNSSPSTTSKTNPILKTQFSLNENHDIDVFANFDNLISPFPEAAVTIKWMCLKNGGSPEIYQRKYDHIPTNRTKIITSLTRAPDTVYWHYDSETGTWGWGYDWYDETEANINDKDYTSIKLFKVCINSQIPQNIVDTIDGKIVFRGNKIAGDRIAINALNQTKTPNSLPPEWNCGAI